MILLIFRGNNFIFCRSLDFLIFGLNDLFFNTNLLLLIKWKCWHLVSYTHTHTHELLVFYSCKFTNHEPIQLDMLARKKKKKIHWLHVKECSCTFHVLAFMLFIAVILFQYFWLHYLIFEVINSTLKTNKSNFMIT